MFHQDAHSWETLKEVDAREMAMAARESSRKLKVLFFTNITGDQCEIYILIESFYYILGLMFIRKEKNST